MVGVVGRVRVDAGKRSRRQSFVHCAGKRVPGVVDVAALAALKGVLILAGEALPMPVRDDLRAARAQQRPRHEPTHLSRMSAALMPPIEKTPLIF